MKDFFKYTPEELIGALEKEVLSLGTEYPDAVYEKDPAELDQPCLYTKGTAGPGKGCLFGQALRNLGCPAEELEPIRGIVVVVEALCSRKVQYSYQFTTSERARVVRLRNVQATQDMGYRWGEAIKYLTDAGVHV